MGSGVCIRDRPESAHLPRSPSTASRAEAGMEVTQGGDAGFIKFGSRVDLFFPVGTKINLELNQVVKGGVDCIAEI